MERKGTRKGLEHSNAARNKDPYRKRVQGQDSQETGLEFKTGRCDDLNNEAVTRTVVTVPPRKAWAPS